MIRLDIRSLSKIVSAALVFAMTIGSARAETDLEPTYVPDGTWLAVGTAGSVKLPFIDTYASLPNQHGFNGTVVCTLAQRSISLPLGPDGALISATGTQTGQGNWTRVRKNVYAFTAWRLLTGPQGTAVGWAKFWGSISPDASNHFFGEINAAYYTLDFVALPLPPLSAATEGWRVQVEDQ